MHEYIRKLKRDYQFNYMREAHKITKKSVLHFDEGVQVKSAEQFSRSAGCSSLFYAHVATQVNEHNTERSPDSNQFARPWVSRQSGQNPM